MCKAEQNSKRKLDNSLFRNPVTFTNLLLSILILVSSARKADSDSGGYVLHSLGPHELIQSGVNANIPVSTETDTFK